MTLQQPQQGSGSGSSRAQKPRKFPGFFCHKCGAELVFSKDHIAPSGKKIPLDPYFNLDPHQEHCMYPDIYDPDTEPMLLDFLKLIPKYRQRKIIGAVGRAK